LSLNRAIIKHLSSFKLAGIIYRDFDFGLFALGLIKEKRTISQDNIIRSGCVQDLEEERSLRRKEKILKRVGRQLPVTKAS